MDTKVRSLVSWPSAPLVVDANDKRASPERTQTLEQRFKKPHCRLNVVERGFKQHARCAHVMSLTRLEPVTWIITMIGLRATMRAQFERTRWLIAVAARAYPARCGEVGRATSSVQVAVTSMRPARSAVHAERAPHSYAAALGVEAGQKTHDKHCIDRDARNC